MIPALLFGPIYPEWMVEREALKMEIASGVGRTREDVLGLMKQYNQKPLKICLGCKKTCIQKQVEGLTKFECFEREEKP